jgi:hypothetical protein
MQPLFPSDSFSANYWPKRLIEIFGRLLHIRVHGRKLLTTEEDARSAFAEQENNGFEQTESYSSSPLHSIAQTTDPNEKEVGS